MTPTKKYLGAPELFAPVPRPWSVYECDIRESAVDITSREAWLPYPYTEAQQQARLHEMCHVKHSPGPDQPEGNWPPHFLDVTRRVMAEGVTPDPAAVEHLSLMLEENRIDWTLWSRYGIDVRGAREVLDWTLMPDPTSLLSALGQCLQLAWTVWGSRGLSSRRGLALPPARTPDPETGEYFDKCWAYLCNEARPVAMAMIQACLAMYETPTHARRNQSAAELCSFFPAAPPPKPEAPPEKPAERARQAEEKRKEKEHEDFLEDQETGKSGGVEQQGGVEYHDHTTNLRRPSMRISRRRVPISQGVDMRHAHRYFLDKAVFSQRLLTEGGLMIDGSGSMKWTDQDLRRVMAVLPAITVGIYSGFGSFVSSGSLQRSAQRGRSIPTYARICTIAKGGRFSRYEGLDPGANKGNDCDFEALQLLAHWPKPRLWLSDGQVCGGVHSAQPSVEHRPNGYYFNYGKLHEMCTAWMRRHEILRVPTVEVLHRLLRRQRVTLYRSTRAGPENAPYDHEPFWPATVVPEPVSFTL